MVKIHIDPDEEKQLQGAKTEIGDKVKRIWKLIKDDKLGEDGTRAELAELIKQCICYHDHLEGAKTEIYDKVEMIFKLIKYDKLDEDGIRAELLKKEPLAKLVEDFHKQLTCYLHDHLEGHNLGPRNQVSELEMESKEREKELSVINRIMKKLEDTEKYDKEKQLQGAKAEIEDKVKRIMKLINDHDLNEDGTPAEVLKREPLAQFIKDFYIQYQFLHAQYEEQARVNIEEISDLTQQKLELHDRNVDLKKRSADKELALSCLRELNKSLVEIINQHKQDSVHVEKTRAKGRELKTFKKKASEDENQINDHRNEISKLAQENLLMGEKIDHLERTLARRKSEFSALQKAKEEMELYCEKIRKEHAKTLAVVNNEKNELANKNMDLQRTLAEREDAYQKLNEEYEQVNSLFNEFFVKLEVAERKMEIMAEEFRQGIGSKDQMVADLEHQLEDLKKDLEKKGNSITFLLENVENLGEKLRLSNQNIRDKEQLLSEKGESFRKAEEKFQHNQRALQIRIATAEATMAADNEAFHETITSTKEWFNSVISGIDTVSLNFFDNHKNIENRISNISHELQVPEACSKAVTISKTDVPFPVPKL